jgi:hypothetical protein
MRRAPLLAPLAWGVATAVASVVSWLGVGAVTRAVTAAPEPVIPAQRIAVHHRHLVEPPPIGQLAAENAQGTTTTTAPLIVVRPPSPTVVVPTTGVSPLGSSTTTTTVPTSQPPAGPPGTGPGGTKVGQGGPPPPQPITVTFSNAGGQMTATCTGEIIVFDSAVPNDGYQETTETQGPQTVEVYFNKGKKDLVLESECSNGVPVAETPSGWGVNPGQGSPNPGQF